MTTGADLLLSSALRSGIEVCFANPGTTELDLVAALDRARGMRTILGLFEGVCSGAADGYARMAGRPALGLFHLGPGFANSLANQHNARRHRSPVVNLIGDQASWHLAHDAPLTSDIDALTGWCGWTRRVVDADDAGPAMAEAFRTATTGAGRIANLVLPADAMWSGTDREPVAASAEGRRPVADEAVGSAAAALRRPGAAIIAGGARLSEETLRSLGRIRASTGCAVHLTRTARIEVGRHLPAFGELPYFPEPLLGALAEVEVAVLFGVSEPVTFFGYEGVPSRALPTEAERRTLASVDDDLEGAAAALAEAVGAPATVTEPDRPPLPDQPDGPLDPATLGVTVARALPEGAIVIQESVSSGGPFRKWSTSAAPHTIMAILGGAIGGGLPAAVGAAVPPPDRPVIALQADGSAAYTVQSLWTMAREQLDVTVVLLANRRYQILDVELHRAGMDGLGDVAKGLTDLGRPDLDWAALAGGFGVPGQRVHTATELAAALERSLAEPGPHLVEAVLG
jgi:acetolactate synthase I/II/III large subunit